MARPKKTTTTPVKKKVKRGRSKNPVLSYNEWLEADPNHKPEVIAVYQHESTHHVPDGKDVPLNPEPGISEIDLLAIFCDSFNNYDDDAKDRVMAFLASKYSKHIYYNQKTN